MADANLTTSRQSVSRSRFGRCRDHHLVSPTWDFKVYGNGKSIYPCSEAYWERRHGPTKFQSTYNRYDGSISPPLQLPDIVHKVRCLPYSTGTLWSRVVPHLAFCQTLFVYREDIEKVVLLWRRRIMFTRVTTALQAGYVSGSHIQYGVAHWA